MTRNMHVINSPQRRPATACRAVTLVELLIVVALIALLLTILLPALRGARDQTHRTICQTNQRQILLAMQFYAADHEDEWFTFNHIYDFNTGQHTGVEFFDGAPYRWRQITTGNSVVALAVHPGSYRPGTGDRPATAEPSAYLPTWNVLTCPATANRITRPEHLNDIVADRRGRHDDQRQAGHSYSYLNGFEKGPALDSLPPGLRDTGEFDYAPRDGLPDALKIPRAIVDRTARVILLADGDNRVLPGGGDVDIVNCPDNAADNHGPAGWNMGFADGHVKWHDRLETFWALYASDMHGHWTPGQHGPDVDVGKITKPAADG